MSRTLLLGLLAAACTTEPVATDPVPDSPADTLREWRGDVADGGFGARLAGDGDRVWVAAPFAGQVFEGGGALVGSGPAGSFFGAGLGWSGTGLVIGAPGVGEVRVDGVVVLQEEGVGGVIAAGPGGWVASTPTGWVAADGTRQAIGRRPDALLTDGEIVAGAAFGPTSVWVGGVATPRSVVADEAGAALLRCDTDGDDVPERIVGAPGAGLVWVGDTSIGPGAGRFGAALACGSTPGTFYVGAPAAGGENAGAVYAVRLRGAPEPVLTGNPLDELGSALLVSGGWLYAGAPGPASGTGRVLGVPEP